MNDPFEARAKIREETFQIGEIFRTLLQLDNTDQLRDSEKQFLKSLNVFLEESKKWGIYSLSKSYNNRLLWAHYADAHRGLCIEYDLDELVKYNMNQEAILDVKYSNDIPEITIGDMFPSENINRTLAQKIIATKPTDWAYESEVRIVTGRIGSYEFDYRAVKAIYFGHLSDTAFQRLVMTVLKGRNIKYYLVEPVDGSYELERREIEDLYR